MGWLRPVILVPVSFMTQMTPAQIEAILAHELAHLRRHDYLMNLLQVFVETVFFYHPAVWWLSRRIRIEREHCCDDVAASFCDNPLVLAEALAQLEMQRAGIPCAMAALGSGKKGDTMKRIKRLLDGTDEHRKGVRGMAGTLMSLGLVTIPDHDDLDTHDAFTLSAWVHPRARKDYAGRQSFIFTKWHWANGTERKSYSGEYILELSREGQLGLQLADYDSPKVTRDFIQSQTIVPLNQWTHVAATFYEGETTLFINGRPDVTRQSEVTSTTKREYRGDDIRIGGHLKNTHFFVGSIDDVSLYNRALSDDEVTALYQSMPLRSGYYNPEKGTMPTEQGFRLFDTRLSNEAPSVNDGVLLQGPTTTQGTQWWAMNRIPLDFVSGGLN
ncbi:MAG: LamG-like jellyroll fold domain-containing protein, partial [Verrucomicrobiota bacterium]